MGLAQQGFGGNVLGRSNAAAGTAYYGVVPGKPLNITAVSSFMVTSGNTANDVYFLRPLGRANVTVAATTADASLTLDADPSPSGNTIAAGDQVVIQHSDGTYRRAQVNTSGWNGTTKVVTFTGVIAANVALGAKIWNFGVHTDTDPVLGTVHPIFPSTVNTTRTFSFSASGIRGHQTGDPLLFYCPNATNATNVDNVEFARTLE